MGRHRPTKGQYGMWECVTCGRMARPVKELNLLHGWLNYGCGRLCPTCHQKFRTLPVNAYVYLGNGVKLVKVSSDRSGPETEGGQKG